MFRHCYSLETEGVCEDDWRRCRQEMRLGPVTSIIRHDYEWPLPARSGRYASTLQKMISHRLILTRPIEE